MSRDGAFGILMAAAVGTLFLVPAHGSAQDSLSFACARFNFQATVEDLTRCAEQGLRVAQFSLGYKYDQGEGVPRNLVEAARWYRLAAEQGDVFSQSRLGLFYSLGGGVPEDDAEAVHWFRMAAEQGHATAQFNLGQMYARGEGAAEDDAEAVRWYRMAAHQGLADAQYNLGLMYLDGSGVPEDVAEAVRWFRLAVEQGHAVAQYVLARMMGEPSQGYEPARENKDIIEQRMTREQIAEAQRLSREWIETHPQDGGN